MKAKNKKTIIIAGVIAAVIILSVIITTVSISNRTDKPDSAAVTETAAELTDEDNTPEPEEDNAGEVPEDISDETIRTDKNDATNYVVEQLIEDYINAVNNGDAKGMVEPVDEALINNEVEARTDIKTKSELTDWVSDTIKELGVGDTWKVSSYAITAAHTYEKDELEYVREMFANTEPSQAKQLTIKAVIDDNGNRYEDEYQTLIILSDGKWHLTEYDIFW